MNNNQKNNLIYGMSLIAVVIVIYFYSFFIRVQKSGKYRVGNSPFYGMEVPNPKGYGGKINIGLCNNNPGNIRFSSANDFPGKFMPENASKPFEQFKTQTFGAIAHLMLLQRYFRNGKNTIRLMSNTWAPPSENDTTAYLMQISNLTGIDSDNVLPTNYSPKMLKIAKIQGAIETGTLKEKYWNKYYNIAFLYLIVTNRKL